MGRLTNRNSRGFTILELMIGMAIFLIISGAVLIGMGQYQVNYRKTEISTQMQQQLRSTMELMAAEIGQAGLQASTVEGGATGGDATFATPYRITPAVTASTTPQSVALTLGTGVFSPYVGQWLMVDGGTKQEAVQVTAIGTGTITGAFGISHAANTAAYPMGVFPHGILANPSGTPADPSNGTAGTATVGGGKLALFGEINGGGNGLWAVEYACPATYPGPLTRSTWSLSAYNPSGSPVMPAKTTYNLIDNVTVCYFCWQGVNSVTTVNSNCPATDSAAAPTVTLPVGTGSTPVYSIITGVGFTITAQETVTISGSTQNVSVTKSYSNIQPRNLITANNILNSAIGSAITAGACTSASTCSYTNYAAYLNGELQPDPAALTYLTTNSLW